MKREIDQYINDCPVTKLSNEQSAECEIIILEKEFPEAQNKMPDSKLMTFKPLKNLR